MPNEDVQVAQATNRDVSSRAPSPRQDCRDVLHISIFFDGTGNNDKKDGDTKKWSNVARLYLAATLAAQADETSTFYPIYVAGVGTKFNGRAADWISATSAWIEDGFAGAGAGAGGTRRMEHADDMVNTKLRSALIENAKLLGGETAKYAEENSSKSFEELNASLSKHRLIKSINLSIFGFSRGAALARAFSNRIVGKCDKKGELLRYQGYPLRMNFLGVFDTVASFGVPAQNARTPFTERELIVSSLVERCVHLVAAHELRFSFPVDLIRKDGKLVDGWIEKVYPGVHSDVGGGYEPIEQDVENNYARIPMRAMMRESLHCGVRLLRYEDIKNKRATLFKERFECTPETERSYRSYMSALPTAGSTVEEQIKSHLKLYYSVNGTMYRNGVKNVGDQRRGANKLKYIFGSKGMAFEVRLYRSLLKAGKWLRLSERNARGFAQYVEIKDWQLAAWDTEATPGAVDFVSRYVHDSKVDFMGNIEPFTYFRPRGVDESSVSVWTDGGNWIRNKVGVASGAVRSVAEAGKEKLVGVAEGTAAISKQAVDAVRQRAVEASDFASRKAEEASGASAKAYNSALESGRNAVDTVTRKASELEQDAEKIYENGVRWAHKKMFDVGDYRD
jgi:hypothetical protein